MTDPIENTLEEIARNVEAEVGSFVKYVGIRESSNGIPLINLTTLEEKEVCVAVTVNGLCIVGDKHDCFSGLLDLLSEKLEESSQVSTDSKSCINMYENIHTLLDNFSPLYRDRFASELYEKLCGLKNDTKH